MAKESLIANDAARLLAPGGPIARAVPGFESRPGQITMARAVAETLDRGGTLLIESPTGTGKTLSGLAGLAAYLSRDVSGKAIYSTATITLQEQLVRKDLPVFNDVGRGVRGTLLKGMGRYLCKLKARGFAGQLPLSSQDEFSRVRAWMDRTASGDQAELPNIPTWWGDVAADHQDCLGDTCSLYDACFAMAAREQARRAQLIVTNHHLLLLYRRYGGVNSLLPSNAPVVVDECFPYDTRVLLPAGRRVAIGRLVRDRYNGLVMSFNEATRQTEARQVTAWFRRLSREDQVHLKFDNRLRAVTCTANHRFYTPRGVAPAGALQAGDLVYLAPDTSSRFKTPPLLSPDQRQVVLGSLLGDGSIRLNSKTFKARLKLTHGAMQAEYLAYKLKLLQPHFATPPSRMRSGYTGRQDVLRASSISSIELAQLYQQVYVREGRRAAPSAFLKQITELGLAIAYMDDGALTIRNAGTYTASLHLESLGHADRRMVRAWLRRRWNLHAHVRTYSKNGRRHRYLAFSVASTRRLSRIVAPYVHPSMAYKLLPPDRGKFSPRSPGSTALGLIRIRSVTRRVSPPRFGRPRAVYNITVDGNHNYFANDCLVANCHHLADVATEVYGTSLTDHTFVALVQRLHGAARAGSDPLHELIRRALAIHEAFMAPLRPSGSEPAPLPPVSRETLAAYLSILKDLYSAIAGRQWDVIRDPSGTSANERAQLLLKMLEGYALTVGAIFDPAENTTSWVESLNGRQARFVLRNSPITVGGALGSLFGEDAPPAILTSATLAAGGSFAHLKARLGISAAREIILPPVFDYQRQMRYYLPSHPLDPRDNAFTGQISTELLGLLHATEGRALLLFTSYQQLRAVADVLRGKLPYTLLVQDQQSTGAILQQFKDDVHSVLLATSRFWEGVDVQGPSLSALIVIRLPFDVPTHPLARARYEAATARGENAFQTIVIPDAIIKLRQGVGRLIRSTSDRGVVAILDGRVQSQRYGRQFLAALPQAPAVHRHDEVAAFLRRQAVSS